jgi:hypothetical protein
MSNYVADADEILEFYKDRKCRCDHKNVGRCIGKLSLYWYPWCNQVRLGCSHCGTVAKFGGVPMDPMPHIIASKLKAHFGVITCTRETSLGCNRERFREIQWLKEKASRQERLAL